jgi:transcriptional regulator with XRE-family HTH domain
MRNFVWSIRIITIMKIRQGQGKIHIGSKIREKVDTSGMTVTEFADKISYSRRNIYSIFSKESIDTSLLFKISEVLKYDFFNDFSKLFYAQKDSQFKVEENDNSAANLKKQHQKVEALEKEITYLKKIIDLMEKKEKLRS